MSQTDKLQDCKQEIRSVLLPFQKGCYFNEFNRVYRELLGKRLPARDFGFPDEINFLYSMPDVVKITQYRGNYHLQAVADESTKHIQKMVTRQKPAKGKAPPQSFRSYRSSVIPPRFTENIARHIDPTSNGIKRFSNHQPKEENKPPNTSGKNESFMTHKTYRKQETKLPPKTSPKDQVVALVQYFGNKLALHDVLIQYKQMYEKDLLLSKYGYSSIEECLKDIPELSVKNINRCAFVVYESEPSDAFATNSDNHNTSQSSTSYAVARENNETLFNSFDGNRSQNNGGTFIPIPFKKKLKMVSEKYKEMRSSEFPSCFERVTGSVFDIHSLGYTCLIDLIDDVPDIFTRISIPGGQNDYVISVAGESNHNKNASSISHCSSSFLGAPLIDRVILNIRNILEAYSEGIEVQEFHNTYNINCQDVLRVEEFGFGDLETFLKSIKSRVPLIIDSSEGVKVIRLVNTSTDDFLEETIPVDAAFPNFKFSFQSFPVDLDFSMYFPVYTSSVASPGHLYIQLQGENADELMKISKEIETFYNGNNSELYKMKQIHIKIGASCVAKWPTDNHWYRAEITSIASVDTVSVFYVDYGTRDIISTSLLRYIKKDFVNLPAQAIKCRLAFLKPARKAAKWSIESRTRILSLCEDTSLMAKIENIGAADGVYSIVLCDTNGEEDVYINDVLRNEGLAEYDVPEEDPIDNSPDIKPPIPPVTPPVQRFKLNPLQALQAKYFLQAMGTISSCFAQDLSYIDLLNQINICIANPTTETQTASTLPCTAASGPPGFNNLAADPIAQSYASTLINARRIPSPVLEVNQNFNQRLVISDTPASREPELLTTPNTDANPTEGSSGIENDIFEDDDDDDEVFQQFCQRLYSKRRYVKKVSLGEGYKIHVIVVESEPYVSIGDVSHLIWINKDADYLFRRMQVKNFNIPTLKISEDSYEQLFQQLEKYDVKGVQKTTGCKSSILLFPLKVVIKILNYFGHPSMIVRTKLSEEFSNFNPNDPIWLNVNSPVYEEPEEEFRTGVTDDDKIQKLCLFDLMTMKESINQRKRKMMNIVGPINVETREEMEKLDQLLLKVLRRIREIKEICNVFAQ